MRRFLIIFVSTLLVTFIPGTAIATPSDVTIYPLICSDNTHIYLEYGINTVTLTNPNGCDLSGGFGLVDGTYDSTWTYSKTISGTTTSGPYPNIGGSGFNTGALGSADSFSLTQTSGGVNSVRFVNGLWDFNIHFNRQFGTLNPDPVGIGQEVTVTGSNLSSVTIMSFRDGTKYFPVVTGNRTSSQLTFTVPSTYVDFFSSETINVTPGTYTLFNTNKTLTLISAPPATTAPDAPTIGTATALSPTSASISFTAPTSNGGATIDSYTATSTPGSFTGQILQSGSGTITVTGLTASTAYTFTVTASNSAGTSSPSSASTSITMPASEEELAAQAAQSASVREAAARAAHNARVAAAEEKLKAVIARGEPVITQLFMEVECFGATEKNISLINDDIALLTVEEKQNLKNACRIVLKYATVDKVAAHGYFVFAQLVEAGITAPQASVARSIAIRELRARPSENIDTIVEINEAITYSLAVYQARKDRLAAVIARNAAR